jgi:hypothetical protein
MKNIFSSFATLITGAACALALGSCSRAEYVMLPQGPSYHGVTRVATPVPVAPAPVAAETAPVPAPAAPEVAVATAPAAELVPAAKPVVAAAATPAAVTQATVVATPAKSTLSQRLLTRKVMSKVDKIAHKLQPKNQSNTASTQAINSNLKLGIILLVVGALVTLLPGGIFDLIGAIIAIIGLLFILLAILDMV